ncbi:MAG: hypothetical protein AB7F72_04495 [Afipia sp.]|jgi:hypothetical protein
MVLRFIALALMLLLSMPGSVLSAFESGAKERHHASPDGAVSGGVPSR